METKKKRFVDNGDGTVTDFETQLMWKQTDSFQDTSKWLNWYDAINYIQKLNDKKFAGFNNWRLPTLEEAEGIYDENIYIKDTDRLEIFIDSSFSPGGGFSTWTNLERAHSTAAVFYYRYGHENLANKEEIGKESVRPVRNLSGEAPKPMRNLGGLSSGRYTS
ncbi:MAG: hypothetical protein NPINA01_23710 [Nitrospinaceae bacterium]|nr:MAG: hypothetical protein NPINA01_23710 [Nitrospinaceae bacterium]